MLLSHNSLLNCANGTKAFADLNGSNGSVIVFRSLFVIGTFKSLAVDVKEAKANGGMSRN